MPHIREALITFSPSKKKLLTTKITGITFFNLSQGVDFVIKKLEEKNLTNSTLIDSDLS